MLMRAQMLMRSLFFIWEKDLRWSRFNMIKHFTLVELRFYLTAMLYYSIKSQESGVFKLYGLSIFQEKT